MKTRSILAWLVVGIALTVSRLVAQDVIVTDPAWLDPEAPAADVLPTFKKRPKVEIPEEIKGDGLVAYTLVRETIDENCKRVSSNREHTNPYLNDTTGRALAADAIKYNPAKRDGKAVITTCAYSIIFNPRLAAEDNKNAVPRVLAVASVVVKKKDLPDGTKLPLVIWATVRLDEKGRLQNYAFEDPAHESLRPQAGGSLHVWRFAPAKREGQPVAAELKVPLILNQQYMPKMGAVQPKVLHRVQPVYPREMKVSRLRGDVLIEFVVDKSGVVKDPVVKQTNNPGFNEAALEAILKWKFEPGRVGGLPVNARMQQPMVFEYDGPGGSRDLVTVEKSEDAQQNLPEKYRYDIAPKPKGVLTPVYPHALLLEKVNGKASVMFLVNGEGRVSEVKVLEASHPEFGLAMMAAVEAFSFVPAMRGGKPTATILKMEQKFHPSGFEQLVPQKDLDLLSVEKKHPENILSAGKLDNPLNPISRRAPVFPAALRNKLDRGEAKIEVLINEEGRVCLPRIATATDPAFGFAAIQAVVDWRFEPPKAGGKPVVARVAVPFVFKLAVPKETPEIPVPEPKQP